MAVRIRLTRVGATKRPSYRVIAIDKRRARDGRALEILGFYDPLTEPATVRLETDRIKAWIGNGAQPSETVLKLIRIAESGDQRPTQRAAPKPKTRKAKGDKPAAPTAQAPVVEASPDAQAPPVAEASTVAEASPDADGAAGRGAPEADASAGAELPPDAEAPPADEPEAGKPEKAEA